jgi:large subunit ribosomal protein L19
MLSVQFKDTKLTIGDTIKVKYNIVEGGKTRVQAFEGIFISAQGKTDDDKTFTVRKIGDRGVGVERIWPLTAKTLVDIEVVKNSKKGKSGKVGVRRAKLYYLRDVKGRMATRV